MLQRILIISLILFSLFLFTCDEEPEIPTAVKSLPPALEFTPDTLRFKVPGDSLSPALKVAKTVQIWNSGGGSLRWSLWEDIPWLTMSYSSGKCASDSSRIDVFAWFELIGGGQSFSGDIFVSDGTQADTIHAIAVNNSVEQICAVDSLLEFIAVDDPGPKILQVRACGNWGTRWKAQSNTSWILVSPDSGSSMGELDTVTVSVDWPAIEVSKPEVGSITLIGPSNNIEIKIRVSWPESRLCVDREMIYLDEDTNPGPGEFLVRRCYPGSDIAWTATVDRPWASLFPTKGTCTSEWSRVSVSIDWSFDWTTVPSSEAIITVEGGTDPVTLTLILFLNCRLNITEPIASAQWTCGDWETIRWAQVSAGHWLTLQLYKGTKFVKNLGAGPLEPVVSNTGEHLWMVTTHGLRSGSDYRLSIRPDDFGIYDCVDWSEYFTIIVPDCYVWVFDPNVFSDWTPGETRTIRWTTNAPVAEVKIDLYKDGVFVCNIIPSTENDGACEWIVSDCGAGTGKYQVRVTDTADSNCGGFSEYFFLP